MIQSHSKRENYLLAEHYIENYERVYGTAENRPYFKYLRIKSKYFAFQNPRRDQKLLNDTLELIEDYIYDYKSSPYIPYVKTMKTNLTLSKFDLNLEIISLYDRLDKPKAVEFYKRKEDMSWFNADEIVRPDISFIRAVFE
jgi:outer membrane protein assembly factor BamD